MNWGQRSCRVLGVLASTALVFQFVFLSHSGLGFDGPFRWPVAAVAVTYCAVAALAWRHLGGARVNGTAGGWLTAFSTARPGLGAALATLPVCLLLWVVEMDVKDPELTAVLLRAAAKTVLSFRVTWLSVGAAYFLVSRHVDRWGESAAVPRIQWSSRGLWIYWPVFVWGIQSLGESSEAMIVDLSSSWPVRWKDVVSANTVLPPLAAGLVVLVVVIGLCTLLQYRVAVRLGLPAGFVVAVPLPALAAIAGVVLCQLAQVACMLYRIFDIARANFGTIPH